MDLRLFFFCLLHVFLLAVAVQAADNCLTAGCHSGIGQADYQHAPVAAGDCGDCHVPAGNPHPGPESMRLIQVEPDLCLQCHEDPVAGLAYPHTAVIQGCTDCHNPHGGDLPSFVRQAGGKLCLLCHERIMDGKQIRTRGLTIYGIAVGPLDLFGDVDESGIVADLDQPDDCSPEAKYIHGPVSAGSCHLCHRVHGGDHHAMLVLPGNGTCVACHTGIQKTIDSAVSQHEPVANGRCWDCHTPHVSNHKPYLKAYYPREFYAPYENENFALCFNCHDKRAFLYERTSEATGFRNRDQNLHYFHVNRPEKGRVCKSCHGIHGADQEKLLVREVPGFGDWDIPLVWANDGERSTCYVGCHRPKTYDRMRKIENR